MNRQQNESTPSGRFFFYFLIDNSRFSKSTIRSSAVYISSQTWQTMNCIICHKMQFLQWFSRIYFLVYFIFHRQRFVLFLGRSNWISRFKFSFLTLIFNRIVIASHSRFDFNFDEEESKRKTLFGLHFCRFFFSRKSDFHINRKFRSIKSIWNSRRWQNCSTDY